MTKTYSGARDGDGGGDVAVRVVEDGGRIHPLRHPVYHSPSGFEWGYGGSGPADLALALLADALDEHPRQDLQAIERTRAWALHQPFKWAVVAGLGHEGWTLTQDDVLAWVAAHAREVREAALAAERDRS